MLEFRIDGYEIEKLLGQGGMGKVYLARRLDADQKVALKTLLSRSPGGLYRFQREFRAIARLKHPHVIQVFSYGIFQEAPYFTMEYIDGSTIKDYFLDWGKKYKKNDPRCLSRLIKTCHVLSQVSGALHYIHCHGIIHRDIKPGNIMISNSEDAKVMDFGLAREIESSIALTRTGAVVGTASYMSPEQCRGSRLDHRSDLYSLGVVIYELLTGRKPFTGDRPVDVLFKHVEETPEAPAQLNPNIPVAVEQIILRLLEKDPSERFQSALELKLQWDEFQRYLTDDALSVEEIELAIGSDKQIEIFSEPKFSGRVEERRRLSHVINMALTRKSKAVLISGEAGMGKSRLISEATGLARLKGVRTFVTRCFQGENASYRTFNDLMEAISISLWKLDIAEQMELLQEDGKILARTFPGFLHLEAVSKLPDPLPLSHKEERKRLFESIKKLVFRLSRTQSMLIIIDNLQWADEDGLDLFHFIAQSIDENQADSDRSTAGAIGFIGVYRTNETELDGYFNRVIKNVKNMDNCLNIQLLKLTRDEAGELIGSMIGSDSLPARLIDWLYSQTGGNPLFLEELFKDMLERHILYRKRGKWVIGGRDGHASSAEISSPEIESILISQNIREAISNRITGLSEGARKLLDWAGVAGKNFSFDLLTRLAMEDKEELLDILDELIRKKIFVEKRGPEDEFFDFDQALIQEIIYDSMTPVRRKVYHRKFGEYYETLGEEKHYLELLAHHWSCSDQQFKAPPYLVKAGKKAHAAYASVQSIRFLSNSIEILSNEKYWDQLVNDDSLLLESLNLRGDIYDDLGMTNQANEDYRNALKLGESSKDELNIAKARNKLASIAWKRGQYSDAIAMMEGSLEAWKRLGMMNPYFMCLKNLGVFYGKLGDHNRALNYYESALHQAREAGNITIHVASLNDLGSLLITLGKPLDAMRHFEEYERIARKDQKKRHLVRAISNLSLTTYLMGENQRAMALNDEGIHIAMSIDYQQAHAVLLSNRGNILRRLGRYSEARSMHEESLRMATAMEDSSLLADNEMRIAADCYCQGFFAKAVSLYVQSAERYHSIQAYGDEFEPVFELAKLHRYLGNLNAYAIYFKKALENRNLVQNPRHEALLEIENLQEELRKENCKPEGVRQGLLRVQSLLSGIQNVRDRELFYDLEAKVLWMTGSKQDSMEKRAILVEQKQSRGESGDAARIIMDLVEDLQEEDLERSREILLLIEKDLTAGSEVPLLMRFQYLHARQLMKTKDLHGALRQAEALFQWYSNLSESFDCETFTAFLQSGDRFKVIRILIETHLGLGDRKKAREYALISNDAYYISIFLDI